MAGQTPPASAASYCFLFGLIVLLSLSLAAISVQNWVHEGSLFVKVDYGLQSVESCVSVNIFNPSPEWTCTRTFYSDLGNSDDAKAVRSTGKVTTAFLALANVAIFIAAAAHFLQAVKEKTGGFGKRFRKLRYIFTAVPFPLLLVAVVVWSAHFPYHKLGLTRTFNNGAGVVLCSIAAGLAGFLIILSLVARAAHKQARKLKKAQKAATGTPGQTVQMVTVVTSGAPLAPGPQPLYVAGPGQPMYAPTTAAGYPPQPMPYGPPGPAYAPGYAPQYAPGPTPGQPGYPPQPYTGHPGGPQPMYPPQPAPYAPGPAPGPMPDTGGYPPQPQGYPS